MNKGTAIVGFFMSFLAGIFLMWGITKGKGPGISAESSGAVDHSSAVIPVSDKDPIWGNGDAPVTMVIFSDFQCPFCSRVEPTVKQLKDKYGPKQLRVVWKNQPLPFHQNARPAADAAMTVFGLGGSDAFWKFHDLAFSNQQSLSDDSYAKWATQSGVDAAKFKAALASKKYTAKIDEDMALGNKLGANGTPAFRINGVTLVGAQPIDEFTKVIDAQLAEAKKLVAAGTKPNDVYIELTKKNAQISPDQANPNQPAAQNKPQEPPEDTAIWKLPVYSDDPIRGSKDAIVTIVEFSDFQCPFCKRVEATIKQVMDKYGNDVRIVWKDNPLPFHPRAKPAATLARAAYKAKGDKGFWEVHDALYDNQQNIEDADLQKLAEKVGLSWDSVKQAIDGNKYDEKFDQSSDLANDFEARGTPHFFVNGYRITGAQPFEKFQQVIDAQLAKAKAVVARGVPRSKVYDEVMKEGKEPPPPEKKQVGAPPSDSPARGPASAKVVIQEWSDFECPFCKRAEPTVEQVLKEYQGKVRLVWRNMPLPFHKSAQPAAEAAWEVLQQKGVGAFWQFHDKIYDPNAPADVLERPGLEKVAQELGCDMAKFKDAMDSHKHAARIEKDNQAGKDAGINGTPAFVVNGYFISGAQPFAAFKKVISRALKE